MVNDNTSLFYLPVFTLAGTDRQHVATEGYAVHPESSPHERPGVRDGSGNHNQDQDTQDGVQD